MRRFEAPVLATNLEAIALLERLGGRHAARTARGAAQHRAPGRAPAGRWRSLLAQFAAGTLQPARTLLDALWPRRRGEPGTPDATSSSWGPTAPTTRPPRWRRPPSSRSGSGATLEVVAAHRFLPTDQAALAAALHAAGTGLRERGLHVRERLGRGDPALVLTDVAADEDAGSSSSGGGAGQDGAAAHRQRGGLRRRAGLVRRAHRASARRARPAGRGLGRPARGADGPGPDDGGPGDGRDHGVHEAVRGHAARSREGAPRCARHPGERRPCTGSSGRGVVVASRPPAPYAAAMTSRADFTDDEWTRLKRAPFVAGLAVSIADPGGPIEAVKETAATLRTVRRGGAGRGPRRARRGPRARRRRGHQGTTTTRSRLPAQGRPCGRAGPRRAARGRRDRRREGGPGRRRGLPGLAARRGPGRRRRGEGGRLPGLPRRPRERGRAADARQARRGPRRARRLSRPPRGLEAAAVQRHPEATRRRLERARDELAARVHAERRAPDELLGAGPVGRITLPEAQALELRAGRARRAARAAVGDVLVPRPRDRAGGVGRPARRPAVGHAAARRRCGSTGVAAQGLNPSRARSDRWRRSADRPTRCCSSGPAAASGSSFELEVACNSAFGRRLAILRHARRPFLLDACELARLRRRGVASSRTTSRCCRRSRPTTPTASTRRGAGVLLRELNRFCNVWREDDRATWPEAAPSSALLATPQRAGRARGAARSATRTSTPPGSGRSPRPTASACAPSRRPRSPTWSATPSYRFCLLAGPAVRVDAGRATPSSTRASASAVARGQFVPVGGTWIEPDCNLPSGESLVRQFLHGQRFFEREFGRRCREFWNPDVFGYNGQLPQLMRGAGITRFLTQKLSLEPLQPAAVPHVPLAGHRRQRGARRTSRRPTPTTRRPPSPSCAVNARNYKDHDRSAHSLLLFGHGDGGGGPTPADARAPAPARATCRACRAPSSATPRRVLRRCWRPRPHDWPPSCGELYFEYHRGTYTTQAATKRGNRAARSCCTTSSSLAAIAARGSGARLPRGRARAPVAAAAADAVPRHPARAARSARSTTTRWPTSTTSTREGGRLRDGGARGARRAGRRRGPSRSTLSGRARREVGRAPDGGARASSTAPPLRRREAVAGATTRVSVERDGDARRARQRRTCARRSAPDGDAASASSHRAERPRGARRRRPTASSSTTTARSTGTPGTSTPSTSRPARTAAPADVVARHRASGAAARPRSSSSAPLGATAAACAQTRAPRRRRAAGSRSTPTSTGTRRTGC